RTPVLLLPGALPIYPSCRPSGGTKPHRPGHSGRSATACRSTEDMSMASFDLTPFYRSTVGFDRVFSLLDSFGNEGGVPGYPPYNIERTGENAYRITVAVAGFTDKE